jgi:hypothetical protein
MSKDVLSPEEKGDFYKYIEHFNDCDLVDCGRCLLLNTMFQKMQGEPAQAPAPSNKSGKHKREDEDGDAEDDTLPSSFRKL